MGDAWELTTRLGPLLSGVLVPLIVMAVDARLRRRKLSAGEKSAAAGERAADIVRIDGRLNDLLARLEAENKRLAERLDVAERKLAECEAGRGRAFAELVRLRARVLEVERLSGARRWDGMTERRGGPRPWPPREGD